MRHLLHILLLLCLPACSLLDFDRDEVRVRTGSDELLLSNHTSERIFYFVVGREIAARIDWGQHLDPEYSVARGDRTRIAYEEIMQEQSGEEEVVVYWWHAQKQGERVPGALHAVIVEL